MKTLLISRIIFVILTSFLFAFNLLSQQTFVYSPNWESLHQHDCPEWFRDAKFGIFMHWGPMSAIKGNDGWYGRHMYMQENKEWGNDYEEHLNQFGHPSEFGYKDIIPLWKAENWDPEELVRFYKEIGAKYIVPVAVHHDNFDCYESTYQPWNSVNMGPKKDIIGGWKKAAEKYGIRFGVSSHSDRTWTWYSVAFESDIKGDKKGIPYDGNLTKADGNGKWWEGYNPADLYTRPHSIKDAPDMEYCKIWLKRTNELVDKYQPDFIYFDGPLPIVGSSPACNKARSWMKNYGLEFAAHFYNQSNKWHNGKNEAIIALKDWWPKSVPDKKPIVYDVEKGAIDSTQKYPWQCDTSLPGTWFYNGSGYNEITDTVIIHNLCDVVSKNGNYLLNVGLTADGRLPDHERKTLENIGSWLKVNGEAIYGTRPWSVYGEGPTNLLTGHFKQNINPLSCQDIRFTKKGDVLYAIFLGWPESRKLTIKALGEKSKYFRKITNVQLLGSEENIEYTNSKDGLVVNLPDTKPCNYAYTLKIN